uniref:Ground-like domain-containing protein n=1 Tax=Syphacia muris TaxID=451379 RepID=A0A0N5AMN1_9BILA
MAKRWTVLMVIAFCDVSMACHGFGGAGCACGTLDSNVCQPCDGREQYQQSSYSGVYRQPSIGYADPGVQPSTPAAAEYVQTYVAASQQAVEVPAAAALPPASSYYNNYNAQPYQALYNQQPQYAQQPALSTSQRLQQPQVIQNTLPQYVSNLNGQQPSIYSGVADTNTAYSNFGYPVANNNDNEIYEEQYTGSSYNVQQPQQNTFDFNGFVNKFLENSHQHSGRNFIENGQDISEHRPPSPFVENSGYDSQDFIEHGYSVDNQDHTTVYSSSNDAYRGHNDHAAKWQASEQTIDAFDAGYNSAINALSEKAQKTDNRNRFNYDSTLSFHHQTLSPTVTNNNTVQVTEGTASEQSNEKPTEVLVVASNSVIEANSDKSRSSSGTTGQTSSNRDNYSVKKNTNEKTNEAKSLKQNKVNDENCEPMIVNPEAEARSQSSYVTYYDQICCGKILGESHNETIVSAARKCVQLGCGAANAVLESDGHYYVVFLDAIQSRKLKVGTYCISGMGLRTPEKISQDLIRLQMHPAQRVTPVKEQASESVVKQNASEANGKSVFRRIPRIRRFQQRGSKTHTVIRI